MTGKRKGIIFLVVGILGLAGGTAMLVYGLISLIESFKPIAVVESPGEIPIEIGQPGTYTLWHDHETTLHGISISHPGALPSGFEFLLVRDADQARFPLAPARAHTTFSSGSRTSVGVGTFEPNRPGAYTLQIRNPPDQSRVFSLTKGGFFTGFAHFGLWIVLGGLSIVVGLVMLVLGIVFLVMKPKPSLHPARPPQLSPTHSP